MIYYRVAWKSGQTSTWQWKSTKLTSRDAVFRFLQAHSALGLERLCIFSSSSITELHEQLAQQNMGLNTSSVAAEEFLRQLGPVTIGTAADEKSTHKLPENRSAIVPTDLSAHASSVRPFSDYNVNEMHNRRIAIEQGTGGDHDTPYIFTLPCSTPQILAWLRLMGKVQRGELEP